MLKILSFLGILLTLTTLHCKGIFVTNCCILINCISLLELDLQCNFQLEKCQWKGVNEWHWVNPQLPNAQLDGPPRGEYCKTTIDF